MEDNGVWAIVITAGAKYIGELADVSSREEALERMDQGLHIRIEPAYEYHSMMIPQPQGIQRVVQALPVGACTHDIGIYTVPADIIFFEDMEESDLSQHKNMVKAARELMMGANAQKAGLQIARPGQMPPGMPPGGLKPRGMS
jgi:hypothetical protein